jgi:LysR family transcriptional regulator, transcriptional activator for dmlA
VLENYAAPPADIEAVYPERHARTPKVRAFTDFLVQSFGARAGRDRKSMAS